MSPSLNWQSAQISIWQAIVQGPEWACAHLRLTVSIDCSLLLTLGLWWPQPPWGQCLMKACPVWLMRSCPACAMTQSPHKRTWGYQGLIKSDSALCVQYDITCLTLRWIPDCSERAIGSFYGLIAIHNYTIRVSSPPLQYICLLYSALKNNIVSATIDFPIEIVKTFEWIYIFPWNFITERLKS